MGTLTGESNRGSTSVLDDVLSLLTDGLAWAADSEPVKLPSKSRIFQARARLGFEPLAGLFARVATPLAGPATPGCWLAGRRLVAIDGMCLDVADTPDNDSWFGRGGVNKGERAAFPQARVVAFAECGTHVMFDAVVGAYTTPENTLARELVDRLQPGMLLLADRGFCGFPLWARAAATGADLLWRAMSNMKPRHLETLADGTWLVELRPANSDSLSRLLAPRGSKAPRTGPARGTNARVACRVVVVVLRLVCVVLVPG